MMSGSSGSGFSIFLFKTFILFCFFGVIPVTIAFVVHNYNNQAQGVLSKQEAVAEIQAAVQDEVRVLTQQDAVSLQKINNDIAGDWYNLAEKDYKIRYEPDNSFSEYLNNRKSGYGLWRVTVNHADPADNPNEKAPENSSSTVTDYSGVDIYEVAAFRPDPLVSFYLLKTQFESGKKSAPVKYRITYISDLKLTMMDPEGKLINFERSL